MQKKYPVDYLNVEGQLKYEIRPWSLEKIINIPIPENRNARDGVLNLQTIIFFLQRRQPYLEGDILKNRQPHVEANMTTKSLKNRQKNAKSDS